MDCELLLQLYALFGVTQVFYASCPELRCQSIQFSTVQQVEPFIVTMFPNEFDNRLQPSRAAVLRCLEGIGPT
jgi:hypothetical protein